MSETAPCYLLQGDDPALLSQALSRLLAGLEGELIAEHFSEPPGEEPYLVGPILEACTTPPFLSDRRVIVVRDASRLGAEAERELAHYLEDPLSTTTLVLVFSQKPTAALLAKARAAGEVQDTAPEARTRAGFVAERVAASGLRLDARAERALQAHLGEGVARLESILGALESAYGATSSIGVEELEPFLGEAGGLAPWDLTDAIDGGDAAGALEVLGRMLNGGGRHPLQVMASLHRHFGAMLALDGEDALSEDRAAAVTGLSPFPAKKAMRRARALGHDRLAEAIALLARADLDLHGETASPPEAVLEVLVARLARLGGGSARSTRRAGARGAR